MKLKHYLKDKLIYIILQLAIIIFIGFFLEAFQINKQAIIFICGLITLVTIIHISYEYIQKTIYYKNLYKTLNEMDKKQYIFNMMEEASFVEGKILYEITKQTTKAMNDEISTYKRKSEQYQEYIETWIHEVKTPIAGISLICENNKNETTKAILEENNKIESYVEQALYYARSNNVEKDYLIREVCLNDIIKKTIKKYSRQLISCKSSIKITEEKSIVYTDSKWLEFILGQIISNSIKYSTKKLELNFDINEDKYNINLNITDNGVGICSSDLLRVFEMGFTGENGRKFAKSTGMGLYLCKNLCNKMNLGFEIKSKQNKGTTIKIVFPKDKLVLLTKEN